MVSYSRSHHGSLVIDIHANTLFAQFLTSSGTVFDRFKIVKSDISLNVTEANDAPRLYVSSNPSGGDVALQYSFKDNAATEFSLYDMNQKLAWQYKSISPRSDPKLCWQDLSRGKLNLSKGSYGTQICKGNKTSKKIIQFL